MPALLVIGAGATDVRELAPDKWSGLERSLIDPVVVAARGLDEPREAWLPRRLRIVDGTVLQRGVVRSGFGSLLADPVVGESVLH